ncbi:MAG: P-II family nitrogen regulator [Balneolaceae bacterium]|jgi:nitrogen regulatory protein P-II 1|nr:MAG: P-II family nitrogen regulator [Balneolaceae bacterium]
MVDIVGDEFKLLFIIVKKNLSRRVIKAVKKGGAEGGTVLLGRGTGTHDTGSIFGVKVEPEKAIILCLVPDDLVDRVISKVRAAARLDKPGTGIAFVVNSKSICGIAHLLNKDF